MSAWTPPSGSTVGHMKPAYQPEAGRANHNAHLANVKSGAEMQADYEAWRDREPTRTSCGFCDWTAEGSAAEGRAAALAHRAADHPKARQHGRARSPKGAPFLLAGARRDYAARQAGVAAAKTRADQMAAKEATLNLTVNRSLSVEGKTT